MEQLGSKRVFMFCNKFRFKVSEEMVSCHLEGSNLEDAIKERKIFIEDLTILADVPTVDQYEVL